MLRRRPVGLPNRFAGTSDAELTTWGRTGGAGRPPRGDGGPSQHTRQTTGRAQRRNVDARRSSSRSGPHPRGGRKSPAPKCAASRTWPSGTEGVGAVKDHPAGPKRIGTCRGCAGEGDLPGRIGGPWGIAVRPTRTQKGGGTDGWNSTAFGNRMVAGLGSFSVGESTGRWRVPAGVAPWEGHLHPAHKGELGDRAG